MDPFGKNQLEEIASDPNEQNLFMLNDYSGFNRKLFNLEKIMIGIEEAGTEIAFVLDGSGSIFPDNFESAKDFISNTMKKVWETCFTCKFAIVQYGKEIRTELSLLENENGTKAIEKVKSIKQIMSYTRTASAINHVLEHVFVAENGSKENAKKMMIVITDGSVYHDPMNLTEVLNSPKMKNILRLAIGVGAVSTDPIGIKELEEIASDPNEQNLFMFNDYSGLNRKLFNLEKIIIGIGVGEEMKDNKHNKNNNNKNNNNKNNNNNNNNNNNSDIKHSRSHWDLVKLDLDQLIHRQRRSTNSNNNNNNNDETEEEAGTEIAFVLDGSGSIEPEDFEKAKDFISNIMKKVWETCFTCEFAIVQYGKEIRTELSLLENENGTEAIEKVKSIKQIMNYTKTASAINHVLEHVFVAENGSKENAKKMMIIITDGRIFLDPMNLTEVLNSPKMKNILRLAIGVGEVLSDSKGIKELEEIASDPHEQNLFMVNDYSGLDRKLANLEKTITGIEGIQQGAGFHFELAEAGFSSHIAHDGNILFGAVGAYDWSGGLILRNAQDRRIKFLNDSSTGPRFSYLGYSVASAQGLTETLYVSGAPRYNLTGSVLVFSSRSHKPVQTLLGEQVGSYFGAVLCDLDFDNDGKTDYLLVGAQYYHVKGEEGKVYVYKLNQAEGRFHAEATQWRGADGHDFAMFGSAIADVGDIDGNRFNDVAVGAPLEGGEGSGPSGSIYIYNGYSQGIRPHFSQRISAADLGMKLRFFGRSVSGMPASQARRDHISAGAEGTVVVLRTLPVIAFKPRMSVDPPLIRSMDSEKNRQLNRPFALKFCFNTMRGNLKEGQLPISYEVDLDTSRATKRLSFIEPETNLFYLTPDHECLTLKLKFMGGHDIFTPIVIKLRFSLLSPGKGAPIRVLDKYSPTEFTTELPFERDCKECRADVAVSDTRLSTSMIIVGHTQNLNIFFNLTNRGDNSPMTTLTLRYPDILLYEKVQPADSLVACQTEQRDSGGDRSQLQCNIMHPVLRRGAQVSFAIFWQIVAKKTELTTADILANLTGANNGGENLFHQTYTTAVKNALKVKLAGTPNPMYLKMIHEGKIEKADLTFTFQIFGENKYNASLFVNIKIVLQASYTQLGITEIPTGKCHFLQGSLKTALESYLIRCAVGQLQDTVVIGAEVLMSEVEGSSEMIVANATLEFDRSRYEPVEDSSLSTQLQVPLSQVKTVRSTAAIAGGAIGGFVLLAVLIVVLGRCGFFRSRYTMEQPGSGAD